MSLSESGQLKLPRVLASELRASYPAELYAPQKTCTQEEMGDRRDSLRVQQKEKIAGTHLYSRAFVAEQRGKSRRRRRRNLVHKDKKFSEDKMTNQKLES